MKRTAGSGTAVWGLRATVLFLAVTLTSPFTSAEGRNPWEPGVEKPCEEALASPLYIRPVHAARREKLEFTVTERMGIARERGPVRGGLPFRRGELADPTKIRLVGSQGREIPVQGLVTSWWPERTVRWLVIDFLTDIGASETKAFVLEYGEEVQSRARTPLRVDGGGDAVTIETGEITVSFSPGERFSGPVKGRGGGTSGDITAEVAFAPLASGREGKETNRLPLTVEKVELVESGLVQATVRLTGRFGDEMAPPKRIWREALGPHHEDYQGATVSAPKFTFHGHARVYGHTCRMEVIFSFGYNGDENVDFVERYGLVVPIASPVTADGASPFVYGADGGERAEAALKEKLTLTQGRHDRWRLSGDAEAEGRRFGGWAAMKSGHGHATVALRNAWQQWPVTFEATRPGGLSCWICGAPEGELLDLRYEGERFGESKSMYVGPSLSDYYSDGSSGKARGLLKISELVLDFGADPADAGAAVHVPLVPFAGAKRVAKTRALGHIGTYEGAAAAGFETEEMERWVRTLLDFPVIQHEANGLYGWVDWPDQADCYPVKDGRFDIRMQGGVGWTNAERALAPYYYHYAAGGDEKYLHLGHAMTLHTIGIDLEHPGGEMMPGIPHRHNQVHWRTGGGPRQCGIIGWTADYWMTGNPEVHRILFDVYFPYYYPGPRRGLVGKLIAPKPESGPYKVNVSFKGGPENWPALWAYLTDNDPAWIRTHKAIDRVVLEVCRKGHTLPYDFWKGGAMVWKDGRIDKVNSSPGKLGGYWLTYGADDRLLLHAGLFGYADSLKALKAFGDTHFGEAAEPPKNRPAGYHSPEAGFLGYYLLTGDAKVLDWLKRQIGSWPARTCLRKNGPLLEWDSYSVKGTADEWQALWGREHGWPRPVCYGKNAWKIQAANIYETMYILAAVEDAGRDFE